MRKSLLTAVFISAIFLITSPIAKGQEKCLSEILFWETVKEDPSVLINRQNLDLEIQNSIEIGIASKTAAVTRVIPVVFHVIHEGGSENISKAQLEDQIRILNEDFSRQNPDTVNTPVPFQAVAGNPEIEFRMATLDPNGNCTDGVVRVFSDLTSNARNEVKAVSYWPSNKYLNIWIVKSIRSTSGNPGIVIGFAQFPGGNAATDGIVLRSDYTGSIGTAQNNGDKGRVATHEVGHWLNLRHIWGDAQCGDDQVADTPQQFGPNQSNCPLFPKTSNCPFNGANGDMFMNYMDYTNGSCQNIFSAGQSTRMNFALSSSLSGRNNLWTQANLIATGTDDNAVPQPCAPVADFWPETNFICVGSDITFFEGSWNGIPTSYQWLLPGTVTGSSTDQNPTVQYTAPGVYDATLIVSNAQGSDTLTKTFLVNVFLSAGTRWAPDYESFETPNAFPGWEWHVYNEGGNTWELSSNAAFTGNNSIWINNYTGNIPDKTDVFITPSYNLTYSTSTFAKFHLAYAIRSSGSSDQLKVFVSTSCGQFWSQRISKSGTTLATAGLVQNNFIPNSTQWREEIINLTSALFSGNSNVRLKFEYTHDTGNNIYIDDINIEGVVGIEEVESASGMNVYPNPMKTHASLEFTLENKNHVIVTLHDVLGREIKVLANSELTEGKYHFDISGIETQGVYYVKLQAGEQQMTRKIVVQ